MLTVYEAIARGEQPPKYLLTAGIPCDFDSEDDTVNLWKLHDELLINASNQTEGRRNLLELKAVLARRMLSSCTLCERKCRANRSNGEKGECGVLESRVSSDFIHMGEEPEIVPSYTIFFSGCTFKCVFCQNWDISTNPDGGRHIDPKTVSEMIESRDPHLGKGTDRMIELNSALPLLRPQYAKNVNWVGGDPTSNLPFILDTLSKCRSRLPQVWNSNMYLTEKSMKILDGAIDLYLTDFKYGNDDCAMRLSGIGHYFRVVSRNHLIAASQCDLIIRHLVLPNHIECCTRPVLEWIAENTPHAVVNIMDQYRPEHRAREFSEISNRLSISEFNNALRIAKDLCLELTK